MIDIVSAINKYKASKIQVYPCHTNRASEIGHPCEKYLVLARTRWHDRTLHDVGLQHIFDDGIVHEKALVRDITEAGINFQEQQRSYELKEQKITGHIDGKVINNDEIFPCEIKSVNPWDWDRIPSWTDDIDGWRMMLEAKKVWLRKWPFQVMCYLYMGNSEVGILLLKNKLSSQIKQVVIKLDYELMESILKKAESVNDHVANNTLPSPIEWEDWICEKCPFLHICLPDIDFGKGLELIDDPELEGQLELYCQLKPQAKECEDLYKVIKKKIEGKTALIGDFQITGKYQERKGFTVKDSKFWVPKIVKVK